LAKLSDTALLNLENINFLTNFTRTSKDSGFSLMYRHIDKINIILNDSQYVKSILCYIISKEEIDPLLSGNETLLESPDWNYIKKVIRTKYSDDYARRITLDARIRWYRYKKNWLEYTKSVSDLFKEYGASMTNNDLNDNALVIFDYSTDKTELDQAIYWMEKVLGNEKDSVNSLPAYLDTYANLLYKAGKNRDYAIEIEEKALYLANTYKIANYIAEYEKAINKMRKGEKTWVEK
jgi:tetratricopeptide (TPR) repeat protein